MVHARCEYHGFTNTLVQLNEWVIMRGNTFASHVLKHNFATKLVAVIMQIIFGVWFPFV